MKQQSLAVRALSTLATLTAFGVVGCGGAPPAHSAATPPRPAPAQAAAAPAKASDQGVDVDAALKREVTGLSEHAAEDKAHTWKVKVPAAADPKVSQVENIGLVEISLGSESTIRCQVYPEAVDPAGTFYSVIKQSSGKVEYRQITPAGVELIGESPAAFLDALYVTDVPGGKAAGNLKMALLSREDHALFCIHDELGFRDSFRKVATAFFSSFEPASPPKSLATYSEVAITKLDDTPIGFSVTQLLPGEKPGEREYHYTSTTLVPTSPSEMIFEDTFSVTRYDAKGKIAEETHVEANQGQITMQLKLTRGPDGKYGYEGQVGGKPAKGALNAPRGLTTALETAAMIKKKLKSGGAFEQKQDEYQPSRDPANVVEVTYAHDKDAPARQVTMKIGDRSVTTEVDEQGLPKSGWFAVGQRKLSIERLRASGHL